MRKTRAPIGETKGTWIMDSQETPAHSVLFIPELLRKILECLDDFFQNTGLVCKAWRDITLDVKYRTADLRAVLNTLAPLKGLTARGPYVSASICPFRTQSLNSQLLRASRDVHLSEIGNALKTWRSVSLHCGSETTSMSQTLCSWHCQQLGRPVHLPYYRTSIRSNARIIYRH